MQVSTNKENLYINQVIGEKTETIIVEEDFVVPDIKPDILNTIHTSGTVCIYKKEVMDGKIRIDGCVNAYIMYLADAENLNIRSLNTNLEFSEIIDYDSVKIGMNLESNVCLKSIECRVLNGRKVNIKAIMEVDLKILSNEETEFVNGVEGLKDVQLLNETITLNSLLGNGMTKVYAKDTIILDDIDNLVEVLKADVKIINKEIKTSYNKILVKADACVKIVYLTDDGRICKTSQIIPVIGFIDMQDITDDDICDVNFEIKNLVVKPNNIEEHSVFVEIELEVVCNAYESKQVNLIQDLYCPNTKLNYNQKEIRAICEKCIIKDVFSIRENLNIPEIGNNKIYDIEVTPIITNQTVMADRIVYEGEIKLNFIFETESGKSIDMKELIIPLNYNMNCRGAIQTSQVKTTIDVVLQDFTITFEQNIEAKIDLEFTADICNTKSVNVIDNISIDETDIPEKHSLIIYFVKPGDTLWKIAKKFNSTIQNITEINQLEDENKLNIGDKLFIPISI